MSNPVTITAPEGLPFIEIEREFDFPVEDVFRAHQDRDLFAQWIGPRGYRCDIDAFDPRTGGRYRFVHHTPDGQEAAFNGVFHLVRPNERIVQTFEYEGWPDVVSIDAMSFEPLDGGRSRLRTRSVFPSVEARDGMVASGMERGVVDGYEQLEELLAA
jgi:uncharacterized protein YndB with AHSA1/START domain